MDLAPIEPVKQLSPPICRVAHAWMTEDAYAKLERAAEKRRMHPDALLGKIAARIFGENALEMLPDC